MFSVLPLWKKGKRRPFFLLFFLQNGRRTQFPKQLAGLFFQDGRQYFFFLMGPTWTRNMTSVYLGLDSIYPPGWGGGGGGNKKNQIKKSNKKIKNQK